MAYARNAWYVAAWSHDVQSDKPYGIKILGEPIVIWYADDKLVAMEDRCVHRLAPLSLGRCEKSKLRCMYHGLLFDQDGKVVEIPGQDLIPQTARVRTYPAVIKHSWVWVWMGDPAAADETLIPPAVGLDDPEYIKGSGYLDYAAEAKLINENLLDFSHLSYVHEASFQTGTAFADEQNQTEVLARGIRFTRWIVNSPRMGAGPDEGPTDNYMSYDFMIPGILIMWNGSFPLGTAEKCAFGAPNFLEAISGVTQTSQAVTPTGDRTSRYFFNWGPSVRHGDAQLRDILMDLAAQAFMEDKIIIEAQQKVIDAIEKPVIMPTVHDKAVTLFNRMVDKLAREERAKADQAA